jgi:tRNA-binding EMAP/Myf-like protein
MVNENFTVSDRRRALRHVFSTPLPSDMLLIEDVTVDRLVGDRLVVTSSTAYRTADALVVQLINAETPSNLAATVVSTQPVVVDGAVCFRIELRIDAAPVGPTGAE